ncbi:unnamed protein product [Taenia asiatica]|uniref:Secreted protein n=1 Tax=Taenia asiatica TaxID=60517 RepID=A0A0R3WEW4_TAEAS|nr:unnamed protein product [Taenia asiatica]
MAALTGFGAVSALNEGCSQLAQRQCKSLALGTTDWEQPSICSRCLPLVVSGPIQKAKLEVETKKAHLATFWIVRSKAAVSEKKRLTGGTKWNRGLETEPIELHPGGLFLTDNYPRPSLLNATSGAS